MIALEVNFAVAQEGLEHFDILGEMAQRGLEGGAEGLSHCLEVSGVRRQVGGVRARGVSIVCAWRAAVTGWRDHVCMIDVPSRMLSVRFAATARVVSASPASPPDVSHAAWMPRLSASTIELMTDWASGAGTAIPTMLFGIEGAPP